MNKQLNTEEMPLTTENMEYAPVMLHPNTVIYDDFSTLIINASKTTYYADDSLAQHFYWLFVPFIAE